MTSFFFFQYCYDDIGFLWQIIRLFSFKAAVGLFIYLSNICINIFSSTGIEGLK